MWSRRSRKWHKVQPEMKGRPGSSSWRTNVSSSAFYNKEQGVMSSRMVSIYIYIQYTGLCAEILQRGGDEFGVFKKEGGISASSVKGITGRQCLKISLVILKGARLTQGGGGGDPLKYTPVYIHIYDILWEKGAFGAENKNVVFNLF